MIGIVAGNFFKHIVNSPFRTMVLVISYIATKEKKRKNKKRNIS